MKKRDLLTPIGSTLGFIMIMIAIIAKGGDNATSFKDLSSICTAISELVASRLNKCMIDQRKVTGKVLNAAFQKGDKRSSDWITLCSRLSEQARREGLLALENELEDVNDPFIRKGILLAVD